MSTNQMITDSVRAFLQQTGHGIDSYSVLVRLFVINNDIVQLGNRDMSTSCSEFRRT